MAGKRADRTGSNRTVFEKNARYIYKTREVCGICGLPVDMSLKSPDPMSKTIDHIIPVSKGGHPYDLSNLQLAHRCCNRQKGDKLFIVGRGKEPADKNSPGHQNNPPPVFNPGHRNETDTAMKSGGTDAIPPKAQRPEAARTSGTASAGYKPAELTRAHADNDNLPQHADWSTYTW